MASLLAPLKRRLAFSLGAMGSARTNFYNRAYQRGGYADVAAEVQRLWVAGRRADAAAAVPDELALRTSFVGTDEMVLGRLRACRDAGETTVRLDPAGETVTARPDTPGPRARPPPPPRRGGLSGPEKAGCAVRRPSGRRPPRRPRRRYQVCAGPAR